MNNTQPLLDEQGFDSWTSSFPFDNEHNYDDNVGLIQNGTPEKPQPVTSQHPKEEQKPVCSSYFYLAVFAALIGTAVPYGFNGPLLAQPQECVESFINSSSLSEGYEFNKDDRGVVWSAVQAAFSLGGIFGAGVAAYEAKIAGPKTSIQINCILMTLFSVLQTAAVWVDSFEVLILGRFLIGLACGAGSSLCPVYLNEISPDYIKGKIGFMFQLSTVIGMLTNNISGLPQLFGTMKMWQYLFMISVIFSTLSWVPLLFCPESPKYLYLLQRKDNKARAGLGKLLRQTEAVDSKLVELENERKMLEVYSSSVNKPMSTVDFLKNPSLRNKIVVVIVVVFARQFTGISAVNAYCTEIFDSLFPPKDDVSGDQCNKEGFLPVLLTIVMGVIQLVTTGLASQLVERSGRRSLFLTGLTGILAGLLITYIADAGYPNSTIAQYFSVCGIVIFYISFGIGPGPVPWFLTPELFDTQYRQKAASISASVNLTCYFLVVVSFPAINVSNWFLIYVLLGFIFLVFLLFKLPETKHA